ncbi:MAG: SgcJ/EcaC family oxidoreductase [Opitutaceae bacterium]
MKPTLLLATVCCVLGAPVLALAGPKEEVAAATQAWTDAFNSRDPSRVVALYDPEAVLWGTVSPTLRDTPEAIRDYFKGMPDRPQTSIAIVEQRIRVYGVVAINTGIYAVSDMREGRKVTIPVRFSFTYRQRDGRWMIVDHHSSAMPSPPR